MVINNFVVNTAEFFNAFSETVEKKISNVSSKITELEILLSVLEAKLNSVPGLEFSVDDLPATQDTQSSTLEHKHEAPIPANNIQSNVQNVSAVQEEVVKPQAAEAVPSDSSMVKASDHPDYAPFFRLLKVGVPVFVVQAKVSAAGLDPSFIETPDALISC